MKAVIVSRLSDTRWLVQVGNQKVYVKTLGPGEYQIEERIVRAPSVEDAAREYLNPSPTVLVSGLSINGGITWGTP